MLRLVFILALVGSTVGYPQENVGFFAAFDLSDMLASLSLPFFGLGNVTVEDRPTENQLDEEQTQQPGLAEKPASEESTLGEDDDDSSGAQIESFAEAGVDENGNAFSDTLVGAGLEQDGDEGFILMTFRGSVTEIDSQGNVSMDSYAGGELLEEDGDRASTLSTASVDVTEDGIEANTSSLTEAIDN